ncbi:MAG TPA: hypothetical protein DDZ83_01230 [Nitrospinae bacterium]|nr:hypothetical protein [Nitrospinota bacterium]
MPIKFAVDDAQNMVFAVGSGTVTTQEIIATQREINAPDFRGRLYNRLVDFRNVTGLQVSNEETATIAHHQDANELPEKIAVVTNADLHFGLARMVKGQTRKDVMRIFRDMEKARKWLGLPPF